MVAVYYKTLVLDSYSSSKKTVLTKKAEVSSSSESEPEVEETKRKVKLPKWKKKGQLPIIPVVDKV